jgi:PAS domain S-box-containing protein
MNSRARKLARQYAATLGRYLDRQQESLLQQAYELGRTAIAGGMGLLDVARIHQRALASCGLPAPGPEIESSSLRAAEVFFREALSPFEATHRGFREANLELRQLNAELERRNAELGAMNRELTREIAERRRVERALQDSESKFRSVVQSARDGVMTANAAGRITFMNRRAEEIFGYSQAEVLGKHWTLFAPKQSRGAYRQRLKRVVTQPEFARAGRTTEVYACRRDGTVFPLEISYSTWKTEAGDYYTGIVRDITERKEVEQELRESQERYSMLVETARDVIFYLTPDGRIAALNHAFEVITGWPRAAWLGKPFMPLLHPDDVQLAVERFRDVLEGRPSELWEYRVRKADGQYVVGELTLSRELRDGRATGVFGIGRDITERRRAEAALRESEERFRMMVAAVKDYVICMLDPGGHVASWNQGAERITQYRADEVLGQHCSAFYTPEDIAGGKPRRALQLARQRGRCEEEGWRVRKDGTRFWARATLASIRDEAGGLRGFVKVACDVTERRRAEEALRQSEEHHRRLYEAAQVMQEKLRNLSNQILRVQEEERKRLSRELHDEVGQTLTAIHMNLDTLKRNGLGASRAGRRKIADSQNLLQHTMETVHRFARELRPAMLDELGLLPALRSYLRNFSERTKLRVDFRASPGAEALDGDRKTVLYRIAQESLTNVVKHAQATRVDFTIRKRRESVCVEIKDNGKSFCPDPANGNHGRKRLGLLGMEERVRLVNGTFAIQPQPGKGTTVRVEIPFKPDKEGLTYAKNDRVAS